MIDSQEGVAENSSMRKKLFLAILLCCAFTAFSVTEYDIGGGKTLIVYDDGSIETIDNRVDPTFLIGRQYAIDWEESLYPFISIAVAAEPSLALFREDALAEMMASYFGITGDSISIIFLSEDEVLMASSIEGSSDIERYDYMLAPGKVVYILDGEGTVMLFNDDYSAITIPVDGLPLVFSRVK